MTQLPVHDFSNGMLNPGIGYLMSCLGAFLGLRCLTRARAYTGRMRAIWLLIASVAIGATGIWGMHFVAMLGFTVPGQQIMYNVPITLISLLVSVIVVAIGLFIVGYGGGGLVPVLTGGVVIGVGGMAAMHVYPGGGAANISGYPAGSFLFPLLLSASVLTFLLSLTIAMSPNEREILADASLSEWLAPEPAPQFE